MMNTENYLSIAQAAKILKVSRTAVYKQIKRDKIKAIRIGKVFAIPEGQIVNNRIDVAGIALKDLQKDKIHKAVKKAFNDYGEVLKRLGNE